MNQDNLLHQEITVRNISLGLAINAIKSVLWERIKAIWFFWSLVTGANGVYSDIDFILITDWLADPDEREFQSPLIKAQIRNNGYEFLWAFNIYEWSTIHKMPIWLATILSNNLEVIYDPELMLETLKSKWNSAEKLPTVAYWWDIWANESSIVCLSGKLFIHSSSLSNRAMLLQDTFPDIARYYRLESERVFASWELSQKGIFCTNWSLEDLRRINENHWVFWVEKLKDQRRTELYESEFYWYWVDWMHENIAEILRWGEDYIWALSHLLASCHCIMREILHENWDFIVDGEVTQLFFQRNWVFLKDYQWDENIFIQALFKSEQISWRSGWVSFDLDIEWNSRYAKDQPLEVVIDLLDKLGKILNLLREYKKSLFSSESLNTWVVVSIVADDLGWDTLDMLESINQLNWLIFPKSKAELVLSTDNHDDLDTYRQRSVFPVNWNQKPEWVYHWHMSRWMKISKLSLLRLLSRCQRKDTWMVKPSIQYATEEVTHGKAKNIGVLVRSSVKDLLALTNPDSIYTEKKAVIYL